MLQAIRDKAHGIFAWVMLIMIGVPFALWGIQNYIDTGKEQPMAVVAGSEIFERDVNRVYEQSLSSLVGLGQFDEAELKRESLERLIRDELVVHSAEDKGLAIGDEDVRGFVQTLPYFQTEGKFDKEKYKLMLSSQGMNPTQFIAQIRRTLTLEQYQRGLSDTAFVTQKQIDDFYRLRNQQRVFDYVTVPLKKYEGQFSDQQIETYYRNNIASFQSPERVAIQYIAITLDDVGKDIKPTEEELTALYEEQKNQLTAVEKRKISHILLAVDASKPDEDKSALEKIAQVRQRALAGEDFAKLAKQFSNDTISAEKGGDLGLMSKEGMEPAFSDAAFKLAKGEVSEPVKTSFGYHLIKVTEIDVPKVRSFEETRAELIKSFQRTAAENKFYELGQKLTEQGFEHPDSLEAAAKALNLNIQETGFFTREQGEGIAAEEAVRKASFGADVLNGRNSEPVEVGSDKVYLLRVKEHQPASDKPLAEVKQAIVARMREEASREEARKRATQIVDEVKQGKSLADASKHLGLNVINSGVVGRVESKLSPVLVKAVFQAPSARQGAGADALPGIVSVEDGSPVVYRLLSVSEGSSEKVDPKELSLARDFLFKNLGQIELTAYLQQLRAQGDVYVKPQQ
ncbi:SurA N-terminal domain-containing protein [Methylococcus sp. EFPC2]|uniref:SurA N-terminal domain-containing protein n=1 Tax=Methylococcus sp. EFPC2 TaxID=2812648 RepID=UPI0019680B16|nr:SurA N-terminal domain-containing protein [Methylococcus sp. EFPC2]QSA95518.1 SurA N-terminal domain-containing protein [Methylococcus sp. EFPC2]